VALVHGWCQRGRLHGQKCKLLLGGGDGRSQLRDPRQRRLVVGIVGGVEVGEFAVEGRLDVVEHVVIGGEIGCAVVPGVAGGTRTGLFTDNIRNGEMRFQSPPHACGHWHSVPFYEGLTVEARELDGHDGPRHHLLHGEGWQGNDGRHVAIFKAVELVFDGLRGVPGGRKAASLALHSAGDGMSYVVRRANRIARRL
jgi:hypothetical protein